MNNQPHKSTSYAGQHLTMKTAGSWEYVTRNTNQSTVGIVAITDENKIVLVQQHRPPVDCDVIELPAGLAGDIVGEEDELLLTAAQRELLEETGYVAQHWAELGAGYSSPGLTDESIMLFLAQGLEKQTAGGGVENENITIHEIDLNAVPAWIANNHYASDLKLWAGLYLAGQHVSQ